MATTTKQERNYDQILEETAKLFLKGKKSGEIFEQLSARNILPKSMEQPRFHGRFFLKVARAAKSVSSGSTSRPGRKKSPSARKGGRRAAAASSAPETAQHGRKAANGNGHEEKVRGVLVDLVQRAVGLQAPEAVALVGRGLDTYSQQIDQIYHN